MIDIPLKGLYGLLVFLIFMSAFFSSSETAFMSINRYRLRHRAREGYRPAKRVSKLLEKPDRLLGVILLGNTFANLYASAIATIIVVELWGDVGPTISTIVLTVIILIIAEVAPKVMAVVHAERISYLASLPLTILLKVMYPIVWSVNVAANGLLRLFRVHRVGGHQSDRLNAEEIRSVVMESTGRITAHHQDMLLRILDLEKVTVDDVMIPRNEVIGVDINESWEAIITQLRECRFLRIPLYEDDIDNIIGIVPLFDALTLLVENKLTKVSLRHIAQEPYFVPESTPLNTQLLNFRKEKRRSAIVVDEYGDILGLVTIEDILEEIAGEFTSEKSSKMKTIFPQKDGSYIIDGSVNLRELNRKYHWDFPTDGPKTVSGLVVEYLEAIPAGDICLRLAGYPMEILEVKANMVKSVRIIPALKLVSEEKKET